MAWALEALAVVSEGIFAAQVNTNLVEGDPVGAVSIRDPVLGGHLVLQRSAAKQKHGSVSRLQVHDVGLGGRLIEDALHVLSKVSLRCGDIVALRLERDYRSELTGQIRIQHGQSAVRRFGAEEPKPSSHCEPK